MDSALRALLVGLVGLVEVTMPAGAARRVVEIVLTLAIFGVMAMWMRVNRVALDMAAVPERIPVVMGHPNGRGASVDRPVRSAALEELRRFLQLRGVVVRDAAGSVVAAADPEGLQAVSAASVDLNSDAWLEAGAARLRFGQRGMRLPSEGGRVALRLHGARLGTLDLWEGDPAGLDQGQYQTLTVITRLIAAELSAPARE